MDGPVPRRALAALMSPWWVASGLLLAYLTTYAALSWSGRYSSAVHAITVFHGGYFTNERTWLINGMWVRERNEDPSEPITRQSYAADPGVPSRMLGFVFLPLIAADREWIHRTMRQPIRIIE